MGRHGSIALDALAPAPAVPTSGGRSGHLSLAHSVSLSHHPLKPRSDCVLGWAQAVGGVRSRRASLLNYIISYAFVRVGGVSSGVTQLHLACRPTTQRSLLQPTESCGPLCILSLNRRLARHPSLATAQPSQTPFPGRMVAKKVKGLERKGSHSWHPIPCWSFPHGKSPAPKPSRNQIAVY